MEQHHDYRKIMFLLRLRIFFQRGRSGAHDCADGLRNKLAESEARYAALAAENAGLKNFIISDCHVAHIEPETFMRRR